MKILKLYFGKLRNAEHFQFFTEVRDLVIQHIPESLGVLKFFTLFLKAYDVEDESLKIIQKSGYTEQMSEAEHRRDATFRGLVDLVNSSLNHFRSEIVFAAKQLKIVFDTYGNLAQKPDDEETSGIYNLVTDLETRYSDHVETIGAVDWVAELKENNKTFSTLLKGRYVEALEKPETKMKQARVEVEALYRKIVATVEALSDLTDEAAEIEMYREFTITLNAIVTRYKNRIAQREGMNSGDGGEEPEEEETEA